MAIVTHITLSGRRIEYEPSGEVRALLERLEAMIDDPAITEQDMIGVVYGRENPILDRTVHPVHPMVTSAVAANPVYEVMQDLLFRKRIAQEHIDVASIAARYTVTIPEAAKTLGVHENTLRVAIATKRLASWMKGGQHYLEPRALETFEVRGGRPRPSPLEIVMGHTKGLSMRVRADEPIETGEHVAKNVVRGRLERWRRAVVQTTVEGGSKRAWVLEPGTEENEIRHDPFVVRGRFRVAEKANDTKKADAMWRASRVA